MFVEMQNVELQYIKKIGPKRAEALIKSGIMTLEDLITYFPRDYYDRNSADSIADIRANLRRAESNYAMPSEITIIGQVVRSQIRDFRYNKKMLTLTVCDSKRDTFEIVFFQFAESYAKQYPLQSIIVVSGKPALSYNKISFSHPEIEIIEQEDIELYSKGGIIPKYRVTEDMRRTGITSRILRHIIENAIESYVGQIEETIPEYILKYFNFPTINETIKILHTPENKPVIERAKFRIKFEELLLYQLVIRLKRQSVQEKESGISITQKSHSARKLYDSLPFELTGDQKRVLSDFAKDMGSGKAMNRLLQGDVGSGKTIVAILTMLMVIDAGYQVVLMAPTELLAEQHYHSISKLLENMQDISIIQLVGGMRKKMRNEVLEGIASGRHSIIVGTHALFQKDVVYNNLGLVIIDEQHRFGVIQRAELISLARKSMQNNQIPHVLYMTATPIPRTLTMTVYGDLDVSTIKEMPKNRKPVVTKIVFDSHREEMYDFVRTQIQAGRQAYIVYPLVEKSEKLELKSAIEHFDIMQSDIFPEFKCGLLHGQMFWYEKEEAMNALLNREYQVLIATTVIEVGIDVPNATVMLIENAERFGLSQLHQLRGRVGRGSEQSYCFLMTKDNFKFQLARKKNQDMDGEKNSAIIRMKAMQETNDGFKIAEVDMKLRGPGDILGTKQAGIPEFKYASLVNDIDIIQTAKEFVNKIVADDPHLIHPKNTLLRKQLGKYYKNENIFINIA